MVGIVVNHALRAAKLLAHADRCGVCYLSTTMPPRLCDVGQDLAASLGIDVDYACKKCRHAGHMGICTVLVGGTAYKCCCSQVTLREPANHKTTDQKGGR